MKKLSLTFVLFFLSQALLLAQPAERAVSIRITPNHDNYLYKEGESVKFDVVVLKNDVPIKDVEIRYEVSEDMMTPHKKDKSTLKDGKISVDAGTMEKAGFLRCQVFATYKGREYREVGTVGFSPEKIAPVTTLPDDFLKFWNDAKEKASKVPMDVRMTLVPERCTENIDVYHVNLQSYERGGRLYGMLTIPKAKGKYPAMLKVPGAGIRPYKGEVSNAERGIIIFEIGIHGIPVDLPAEVYTSLGSGALKNYPSMNLDNKDQYYYKRVYLGCVRGIDFLTSLPEYDGKNLITYGGSQGGALSIVTAALDSRVTGLVAFYPALCDLAGYLHNRAGGWPHMFKQAENNTPEKVNTAKYYDVVNFARQLKVPGFFSFGYNDMVCPPTSMYSAMNVITAPKEIMIEERTAHYTYTEQRDASWEWVMSFLNLK